MNGAQVANGTVNGAASHGACKPAKGADGHLSVVQVSVVVGPLVWRPCFLRASLFHMEVLAIGAVLRNRPSLLHLHERWDERL